MKMPQAWSVPSREQAQAREQRMVKARVDMSAEVAGQGLCPECRRPMQTIRANGHEVLECRADRIVLPKPDTAVETASPPLSFLPTL